MRVGTKADIHWLEREWALRSASGRRFQRWVDHLILGAALRLAASTMNRIVVRHVVHPPGRGR